MDKVMHKTLIIFILSLFAFNGYANDGLRQIKEQADSAYTQEKYEQAVELYLQLAQENSSDANLCYNLGCAYYRLDSIAKSILWFERAYQLEPDDKDIVYNLDLVRTKTIDRIIPRHEMFFVSLFRSLVNSLSSYKWAWMGISFFVFFLLLLSMYLFSSRISLRKIGFFASLFCLFISLLSNVCAYQQLKYISNSIKGVIMTSSVTVKSTPSDNGNELFVIHEGTCVEIQDDTMKEWVQIQLSDGKQGWIEKNSLERI